MVTREQEVRFERFAVLVDELAKVLTVSDEGLGKHCDAYHYAALYNYMVSMNELINYLMCSMEQDGLLSDEANIYESLEYGIQKGIIDPSDSVVFNKVLGHFTYLHGIGFDKNPCEPEVVDNLEEVSLFLQRVVASMQRKRTPSISSAEL